MLDRIKMYISKNDYRIKDYGLFDKNMKTPGGKRKEVESKTTYSLEIKDKSLSIKIGCVHIML